MKSFIAALRNLVLPWGRTTGRRIVLDGDNGEILIYNAVDQRVVLLTSQDPPGLIVGADTEPQVKVISESGNVGRIYFDANSPATGVLAAITEAIFNEGAANEHISFQLQGPGVTGATDRLEMLINSQNADGSSEANFLLRVAGGPNLMNGDRTNGFTFFRRVGIAPPASATQNPLLIAADGAHTGGLFQIQKGAKAMLSVQPSGLIWIFPDNASAGPALNIAADGPLTGPFIRCADAGTDRFVADASGTLTTYQGNLFGTYTPTVTGGGSATFSTATGWWVRVGKMIYFTASLIANAAGSGATAVSVTAPQSIYRGTRQRIGAHCSAITGGPGSGEYTALCFTGGSGATIDRLTRGGTDLTGANISATANICIEGWYREA